MINSLIPYSGIGDVRFGMTRREIRSLLGPPNRTFRRTPECTETDYYAARGFFVEFNTDVCEALEFTGPDNLYWKGVNLFALPFFEMRDFYDRLSLRLDEEGTKSVTYHDLGFSLSRSDDNGAVESVLIFSKTYWKG